MSTTPAAPAPQAPAKRIFAPGASGTSEPSQAEQYLRGALNYNDLHASPVSQFHAWFSAAQSSGVHQPETVNLATSSSAGAVSSRMVYLKELDGRGFVIYSNWGTSRKAADVATNARAALCFWWREVERQVRVEGPVERLSPAESQRYFDTRARGSRVGAWASAQSGVLRPARDRGLDSQDPNTARSTQDTTTTSMHTAPETANEKTPDDGDDGRAELTARVAAVEARFADTAHIPVPDFWGGLRILPETVEFWQGRESRLHDRFVYSRVRGAPGDEEGAGGEARLVDLRAGVGAGQGAGHGEGTEGAVWRVERLSP